MSRDVENLILRAKASSLQASRATADVREAAARIAPNLDFLHMGPAARMKALKKLAAPKDQLMNFCVTGQRQNALKSIQGSLPSFSSALRCYLSFCELTTTPAFPVSKKKTVLLRRSSIFNDGRTFENYIGFLWKACFFFWTSP